nr:Gfo/Idh/MocA family oxidoreductase [Streptomyces coryli]
MRIGICGTENSHAEHFIRHLNQEGRHAGARVTALAGGSVERNRSLAHAGAIDTVLDDADELIGAVDAVIVCDRDGHLHPRRAVPALRAGLPVLVDKPLAATVAGAEEIIAAACSDGGGLLASYSAVRLCAATAQLAQEAADPPQTIHVAGPADPESPHAGLFFYGIHHVEAALELAGNPAGPDAIADVQVFRGKHTLTAVAELTAGPRLLIDFAIPTTDQPIGFHATVVRSTGIDARPLTLDADYNAPALSRFLTAIADDHPPMPYDQLLTPVRLMEAITAQL